MDERSAPLRTLVDREKMQASWLKLWKETGKTVILIHPLVEEAPLLASGWSSLAPAPGRIHKE